MPPAQPPLLELLNDRSAALCDTAIRDASSLDVRVSQEGKVTLLDFGVNRPGTFEAGLLLSRICLADLAEVTRCDPLPEIGPWPQLKVVSPWPVYACIASQYAGWPLASDNYYAMVSGPGRLVRGKEEILQPYPLPDIPDSVVVCLESDQLPGPDECEQLSEELAGAENIIACVASTHSLPGTLQVVARSIETALHKLHELGFDLSLVERGTGVAPIPPCGENSFQSLGWTNDVILYGGRVDLWFRATQAELAPIVDRLASCASPDFGLPFRTIFEKYNHDFYQIDRLLFSPAEVGCHSQEDGQQVVSGKRRPDILQNSLAADG
ncbi:MAG: methenyltetrahydromethanopterin cyclohydrolase [Mariniblastus sp.]|nr:methenyltetrahydromethanopterin cyclohydrolase [Mariniblastus sp.]